MTAVTARWKPADQARARPQLPCSKNISAFCAILFQRLSDDAHVGDARLFYRVHDGGKGSEGDVLVGADKNELVAGIANLLAEFGGDLVDVDGVIAEENALVFINGNDGAFFRNFFDGAGFGNVDFDAGLQNGSSHHKNDEQHEHDIDERSDVDIGKSGLRAAVGRRESHQRLTSAAWGWMLSRAFNTSSVKSSPRAANSRIELPIKL